MNIGYDAKRAFLNNTGLGNYSRFIISGMAELFTGNTYSLFCPGIKFHSELEQVLQRGNVHLKELGSGITGSVKRVIGQRNPDLDIFHGLSNELPLLSSAGTRKIVSIHDLLFLRYPQFYSVLDRNIYKIKTITACKSANLVVAISEQTKSDLINYLQVPETKIKVHYQSCHQQFWQTRKVSEIQKVTAKYGISGPYILQVGTLEERKNALLTLKAFSLSKANADYQLILIGKRTRYCDQLESFVNEHRLNSKVKFIYSSEFKDFPFLYQGASLFVYPSVFEGFGIPVLEAMCSKVPVITTKGGCFEEVGANAVLYTDPADHFLMAEYMDLVLSDATLAKDLINKGQNRSLFFKQDKLINELNEIYTSVIR